MAPLAKSGTSQEAKQYNADDENEHNAGPLEPLSRAGLVLRRLVVLWWVSGRATTDACILLLRVMQVRWLLQLLCLLLAFLLRLLPWLVVELRIAVMAWAGGRPFCILLPGS